jgi:hypothetical protein
MNVPVLAFKWMEIHPHLEPLFHSASGDANEHCCLVTMYKKLDIFLLFHMSAKLGLSRLEKILRMF